MSSASTRGRDVGLRRSGPASFSWRPPLPGALRCAEVRLVSGSPPGSPIHGRTRSHNVSNTVTIKADEWEDVAKYIYENRECFSGISMLADFGDKAYQQAPMEKVETEEDAKKWNEMVSGYIPVDWSLLNESDDFTETRMSVACSGGNCSLE